MDWNARGRETTRCWWRVWATVSIAAMLSHPRTVSAQTARRDSVGFVVVKAESATFGQSGPNQQILFGDPSKPGLYVIRMRFAPWQTSKPHFHDQDRFVTVIKGTWWIALGPSAAVYDTSKMVPMKAGSFVVHPAGGIHYDGAKGEEVIVQIMGMGPVKTISVSPP
jgi:quercetin dioxygenase-like cupin family protein